MEIRHNRRAPWYLPGDWEGDPACPHSAMPAMDWALAAAPGNDSGSTPAGDEAERKKPGTPDPPQSITDANSPLTGDTGNLELGQTDLGASGTGSEDPTAPEGKGA